MFVIVMERLFVCPQNECETDKQCGKFGKCIDLAATTYPKKQCFCRVGYFGKKCDQRNRESY